MIIHFLKALFKDIVDQAWTLVALIIGWLVLEGSAKEITGNLILITLAVWVVTFPLRYERPEEDEDEYDNLPKDGDGDGYIFDGTSLEMKDPRKKK